MMININKTYLENWKYYKTVVLFSKSKLVYSVIWQLNLLFPILLESLGSGILLAGSESV